VNRWLLSTTTLNGPNGGALVPPMTTTDAQRMVAWLGYIRDAYHRPFPGVRRPGRNGRSLAVAGAGA
jgi:hypothetical protein